MTTIQHLESELRSNPSNLATRFAIGRAYEEAERFDEAADVYSAILEISPTSAEATFRLGMMSWFLDDTGSALVRLRNAIELDDTNGIYWSNCGLLLLTIGHLEEALAAFEAAWEVDDTLVETPLHIARVNLDLGRFQEALAQELAGLEDTNPDVWKIRLSALIGLQRLGEATDEAKLAVRNFPDDPDLVCLAANIAVIDKRLDDARNLFQETLRKHPDHYLALVGLGMLDVDEGNIGGVGLYLSVRSKWSRMDCKAILP